ncbi:MAG: response regulator transcription factor [Clostridiales bacterium]|nr:response regulator transcription factor [Clostridiales bacterium]
MSRHILLVEDSASVREVIEDYFLAAGKGEIVLDMAVNGIEGMEKASANDYDLAILDIMLPGASGYDVLDAYRKRNDTPVLFLSALSGEDNILKGYSRGVDDYVEKPFSLKVLFAKVTNMIERYGSLKSHGKETAPPVLQAGDIRINTSRMQVFAGENEIELTPKEYAVLKLLIENKGFVVKRSRIYDTVWGIDSNSDDRVVDSHIKKLRKKLGGSGACIKTVIGTGYKAV